MVVGSILVGCFVDSLVGCFVDNLVEVVVGNNFAEVVFVDMKVVVVVVTVFGIETYHCCCSIQLRTCVM